MRIMFEKPVGNVPLREGERIRVIIGKKLTFEPIHLKKRPEKKISDLRTRIPVPELSRLEKYRNGH